MGSNRWKLKINFVDKATTSDANTNAQFDRLVTTNFAGVDLVNGTGARIGPEGVKGNFVDLGKHLNKMPNLSRFLNDNPSVKVSMTSDDKEFILLLFWWIWWNGKYDFAELTGLKIF